ncbi:hypothetical protein [Methanogenium cariaci]|uniref:hypothetical protein n=1 Tax=Methanogenium cariaci TaxID=2197 RepID=UPI0024805600|nr:hypothetical protein [Methanogenium cariaci]
MTENAERVTALRDRLTAGMLAIPPHAYLNGHPKRRLPNNVNVVFEFIEGGIHSALTQPQGDCRVDRECLQFQIAGPVPRAHRLRAAA